MSSIPSAYPFGLTVQPVAAASPAPCDAVILAPLPGALSVRWTPPGQRTIASLPVADEPEALWDGRDAAARITAWQQAVRWDPRWGEVGPSAQTGAPGRWLQERVLAPLHLTRDRVRIAICLDSYRAPAAVRHRITTAYQPAAAALALPTAVLPELGSDEAVIQEVLATRVTALDEFLAASAPALLVTLGGVAYRIASSLLAGTARPLPRRLPADSAGYGAELEVMHRGHALRLLPLAHPAAPRPVQLLHDAWQAARTPATASATAGA